MREAGLRAARAIGYDCVGTIECLVAGDEFFFLEMNTRIQVEHTVSEMISGLDLSASKFASRPASSSATARATFRSAAFAIEVRVNAEDPARRFPARSRHDHRLSRAGGLGVRVDSAAYPGLTIGPTTIR